MAGHRDGLDTGTAGATDTRDYHSRQTSQSNDTVIHIPGQWNDQSDPHQAHHGPHSSHRADSVGFSFPLSVPRSDHQQPITSPLIDCGDELFATGPRDSFSGYGTLPLHNGPAGSDAADSDPLLRARREADSDECAFALFAVVVVLGMLIFVWAAF